MEITSQQDRPKAQSRFLPLSRRFSRDQNASVAIEFSMLAMPFIALTFAILESCISFAGQEVLANVTDDVARQIRTGQAGFKAADLNEIILRDKICERLEVIVRSGCEGLKVDLREFTTFKEAAALGFTVVNKTLVLTKNGVTDADGFKVDPGLSMTKNMLRVFYPWPVMTDFMRLRMSNLDGGKTLHFATATWQNEPFDD